MGAPGCGCVGAAPAGRIGALYTGRGPVCGMIIRGDGACGREAMGAPGRTVGACGGVPDAVGAEL
jgi:hypothetical protein